jgi:hypothetical protein
MSNVYVLYNAGKLRAVYERKADAVLDRERLIGKGYKEARVQEVQLQTVTREASPLDAETIEALKQCVAKS